MPPVAIKPGLVFWPKGLEGDAIHPYIVLSYPVGEVVLVANFSDLGHYPEAECIVEVGEHSCIKKPSYVNFAKASPLPWRKMGHVLAEGKLVVHYPDLSDELFHRVMAAAKTSRHICDAMKIKFGLIQRPKTSDAPF
jgi:hypothetical protein